MYLKRKAWLLLVVPLLSYLVIGTAAQKSELNATQPPGKRTSAGFEVSVLQAKNATDWDEQYNVPAYRYGSCPPGAAVTGMSVSAESGHEVLIIRLGVKVTADYRGGALSLPVLLDDAGKKYETQNTMLPNSLRELLQRQKGTSDRLQCEFPFEIPRGVHVKQIQFDDALLDLKLAPDR